MLNQGRSIDETKVTESMSDIDYLLFCATCLTEQQETMSGPDSPDAVCSSYVKIAIVTALRPSDMCMS